MARSSTRARLQLQPPTHCPAVIDILWRWTIWPPCSNPEVNWKYVEQQVYKADLKRTLLYSQLPPPDKNHNFNPPLAAIPCDTLGSPRGVALLRPLAPFTWAFICIIDAAPQDNRNLYIEMCVSQLTTLERENDTTVSSHDKYCDFCSTSCGAPLNGGLDNKRSLEAI